MSLSIHKLTGHNKPRQRCKRTTDCISFSFIFNPAFQSTNTSQNHTYEALCVFVASILHGMTGKGLTENPYSSYTQCLGWTFQAYRTWTLYAWRQNIKGYCQNEKQKS